MKFRSVSLFLFVTNSLSAYAHGWASALSTNERVAAHCLTVRDFQAFISCFLALALVLAIITDTERKDP